MQDDRFGERVLKFDSLPEDVLFLVFSYCDLKSLLNLACVNRALRQVANHDSVWKVVGRTCMNLRASDKKKNVSWKSLCKVSVNWVRGYCKDRCLLKFKCNYMPCINLGRSQQILVSQGADIVVYRNKKNTRNQSTWQQQMMLRGHEADIGKFVVRGGHLISCGMDKTVRTWNLKTGCCDGVFTGHAHGVYGVDGYGDTIVSGGRDRVVKIWSKQSRTCIHAIPVHDHIWSIGMNPIARTVLSGTAGHSNVFPPLQLWSLENGQLISGLRTEDRRMGLGVLSVLWESPVTFLSCGYDTAVRYWDVRVNSASACVQKWEDPHDSTVYCIDSDSKWMIVSGTNRYGVVRVWDKRVHRRCLRSFYAGRSSNSPVYSLQFNRTLLFVALANGLRTLDFSI